jgi:CheY-like chemotaxis protein
VLLVDDEPDMLTLLEMRLSSGTRVRVETALSAAAALEKLEKCRPAVVLADIVMPVMNGWELRDKIRTHPFGQGVEVLLMTAAPTPDALQRAKEAGVTLVGKPFESKALAFHLERAAAAAEAARKAGRV